MPNLNLIPQIYQQVRKLGYDPESINPLLREIQNLEHSPESIREWSKNNCSDAKLTDLLINFRSQEINKFAKDVESAVNFAVGQR